MLLATRNAGRIAIVFSWTVAVCGCRGEPDAEPQSAPENEQQAADVENRHVPLRSIERVNLPRADAPPPGFSPEMLATVRRSNALARAWLSRSLSEKGLFRYIYDPETDADSTENNELRQLMASRLLAELAHENPALMPLHRRNLQYVFTYWYHERDGLGYICVFERSKLGGNAMALRTCAYSPLLPESRKQARRLADGIVSLLNDDGSFEPWLIEPPTDFDPQRLLYFYSGEAILALTEYHLRTGEREYLDAAQRAQAFYLQHYVEEIDKHYYPAYVPWHTLSMNKLYKLSGDRRYADAVFVLNDRLLEIQDTENEVGRFFHPEFPQFGTPHASSDGVYTEGLAYALEIALLVGDEERVDRYRRAIELAVGNLARLQYSQEESLQFAAPWRSAGALRISTARPAIRIDTTQHTMDAYRKILALAGETGRKP